MYKCCLIFILFCKAPIFAQDYNQWLLRERLPRWTEAFLYDNSFKNSYKLSTYINPFYLEADFNGDGKLDIAIAIENKVNGKKGFAILHRDGHTSHIIGAGKKFGNGGDDFKWMDIWKVHRERDANQLTYKENGDIKDSEPFKIKYPGIDVQKSESGGGLIYWNGNKYEWVQSGD